MKTTNTDYPAPHISKTLLEFRTFPEYVAALAFSSALKFAPRGDGHAVIVIPGFLGSKHSTLRLRKILIQLGYHTFDWRLGVNRGPVGAIEDALLDKVALLNDRTGRKVSLVGWSLGGVYARMIAHTAPELLRTVITLGSPVRFPHQSRADKLYSWITDHRELPESLRDTPKPASIPITAIHSRLDGIVNWRACLADESCLSENIAVMGSHTGLGHHPLVAWIIADRLSQPEGNWQRFQWKNLVRNDG